MSERMDLVCTMRPYGISLRKLWGVRPRIFVPLPAAGLSGGFVLAVRLFFILLSKGQANLQAFNLEHHALNRTAVFGRPPPCATALWLMSAFNANPKVARVRATLGFRGNPVGFLELRSPTDEFAYFAPIQ